MNRNPRRSKQVAFYKSKDWKECREDYYKAHSLCEECLRHGQITAGVIVHHKTHINAENLNDPTVLTSWDNLETLCRKCHAAAHPEMYREKRYAVNEYGRVTTKA